MRVFFRVDCSLEMGTGHVMRCLTLGEGLRAQGVAVGFISRNLRGNLLNLITAKGFTVNSLPSPDVAFRAMEANPIHAGWLGVSWEEDATQTGAVLVQQTEQVDWLIVDHYALDYRWEMCLRPLAYRFMVIDDLADRRHDADLLLDQNLYVHQDTRYTDLVPPRCRLLLGPRFALLRPDFREVRRSLRPRNGMVRRILIFFGGVDPDNLTAGALAAVRQLNRPEIAVDVVVGATNPHREEISRLCQEMPNVTLHCQITEMAALMARADLALGAGGTTTWERCCLGLPSMVVAIAANQEETANYLDKIGAIYYLGTGGVDVILKLRNLMEKLLGNPQIQREVSQRCANLVDGYGCERVARHLLAASWR